MEVKIKHKKSRHFARWTPNKLHLCCNDISYSHNYFAIMNLNGYPNSYLNHGSSFLTKQSIEVPAFLFYYREVCFSIGGSIWQLMLNMGVFLYVQFAFGPSNVFLLIFLLSGPWGAFLLPFRDFWWSGSLSSTNPLEHFCALTSFLIGFSGKPSSASMCRPWSHCCTVFCHHRPQLRRSRDQENVWHQYNDPTLAMFGSDRSILAAFRWS